MQIVTDGLVIMEKSIGEADKLLTILTKTNGVIKAFINGAKNIKGKNLSSAQILSYSRFKIFKGRDKYIINEAQPIDIFYNLRKDIEKVSLAQYFCELTLALAPEEGEAGDFLRLILNALYYLVNDSKPAEIIKAVVELRMCSMAGYMPNLVCCDECGKYEFDVMFFCCNSGLIYCPDCYRDKDRNQGIVLKIGVVTALRHIIYAPFNKVFSFSLKEDSGKMLSFVTENYVKAQLQRDFNTLNFYKVIS